MMIDLCKILPHGRSAIFLDRVISVDLDNLKISGDKRFSLKDVSDHFPERPIVPGAMLMESAAQLAYSLLVLKRGGEDRFFLTEVTAKFRRCVFPEDIFLLEARGKEESFGGSFFINGYVCGKLSLECRISLKRAI